MTGVLSTGISVPGSVSYDDIGRVILSDIEGMTEVQYNVTGFPSYIGQADGGYVHNTYAGGVRLASRRTASDGKVTTMNYEGNEVWENGKLRMLLFDGGYVDFSGNLPKYCWYTKDHLGSVRAVTDADGNVFATYAYRPYGEELAVNAPVSGSSVSTTNGSSAGQVANGGWTIGENIFLPTVTYSPNEGSDWQPFKFGGKESLTRVGLDLYDFGARMYSPSNMRWMTMDPLCEKYYHISPYAYCAGNPVNLVDPDGRDWYSYIDENGNEQWQWIFGNTDPTYEDDNGIVWNRSSSNSVRLSVGGQDITLSQKDDGTLDMSMLEGVLTAGSFTASGIGNIAEASNATFRMTNSKGNLDFHYYKSGWTTGNQYIKPTQISRVSTLGKGIKMAGNALGLIGVASDGFQCIIASSFEESREHFLDATMGATGFIPLVGPYVSIYWTLIGKQVYYEYTLPSITNGQPMKLPEPY